ncbi:MAG TPA: PAS domain S-box protein [Holophagaceae bacterium]|nr:PAS domain S-box protein [Holophagaceae bacterium]
MSAPSLPSRPPAPLVDPALLQAAFQALPSGMTLVDLEGNYLHVSPAFCRMLGYDEAELQGRSIQSLTHPQDWARQIRFLVELKAGARASYQMEKRFLRKDGAEVWAWLHAALLRDEAGRPLCLAAYVQDITDRIASERALSHSLDRLAGILTTMEDGVVEIDLEGRFLYANEAAERILRLPVETITTRSIHNGLWALVDWDGRPMAPDQAPLARALATRQVIRGTRFGVRLEDGSQVWLIANAAPLFDPGDQVRGALLTFLDITETRRSEQALQQSQRLESLGLLAGSIAHDYNNLLGALSVSLELARGRAVPDSEQARQLERAEGLAQRSADLTRQLLAYAGRGHGRKERLDLNDLVRDMGELLKVSLAKRALLDLDLAEGPLPVWGDKAQLQQVLLNLLTNAADAMKERPGTVRIGTSRITWAPAEVPPVLAQKGLVAGEHLVLEVRDEGCGMDEATLRRIFEPFFTTKAEGRGLGLAAMLGIVRSHRGAIAVESAPEVGTTFRIYFPALSGQGHSDQPTREVVPFHGRGLVMVVDDEAAIRVVASEILTTLGFEVITAEDGLEALRLFQAQGQDVVLVLLDLTMPNLDGFQTLQQMRALRPDIRVLLSSGYADPGLENRLSPGSVAGFLPKPYRVQDLINAVKAALEGE